MKLSKILGLALLFLLLAAAFSSYLVSRPVHNEVLGHQDFKRLQMAPREEAITLARTLTGTVLLVLEVDHEGISGVSVAAGQMYDDGLMAFQDLGVDGLQAFYQQPPRRYRWADLGLPVARHSAHVAVGANYRAHAEEVGLEGQPFLFPKLSRATGWNENVTAGTRLDYEVELCAVPLNDYLKEHPARLGYLLCGDFTDRWTLVRHIDTDEEMGRTGFPASKGGETRLPVGPLLLIPFESDFYQQIELKLFVNGALRQKALAGQMIWTPDEVLSQALADCESEYLLGRETINIAECHSIAAGTLILTGTPEGVMFHLANLWNPWAYLREGDVVTSFGTYLGFTQNTVRLLESQ